MTGSFEQQHLNSALVETTRPAMYKTLKYWGKKPVNIWREFIECYCPENGTVLDPFAGSDIAGFEACVSGRKAICFDLNPMSTFFIDTFLTDAEVPNIEARLDRIIEEISNDSVYRRHFIFSNTDLHGLAGDDIGAENILPSNLSLVPFTTTFGIAGK